MTARTRIPATTGTQPRAHRGLALVGPALGLVLALACGHREVDNAGGGDPTAGPEGREQPPQTPDRIAGADEAEPYVHAAPTRFAPALTALADGPHPPSGSVLADTDACASCHEAVATQWKTSAHAFASFNNPIYRASIARFRDHETRAEQGASDQGLHRSRFCAGCHDPALLLDDAMDVEIAPQDPRAHAGVTCRTCHGVADASEDGNGSYTLASAELPLPVETASGFEPTSVARHREALGPARLACDSCHRAFIGVASGHPHHLGGTDEPGPWRDSSYAGNKLRLDTPVQERDCVDCHMTREPTELADPAVDEHGEIRSHRFLGGHTWLAAIRGDDETLARVQAFLTGIASVDIAAVELGGQRALLGHGLDADARGRVILDLVVRNLAVGHRFPGGTRDAQDTWLAVEVRDRHGQLVAALDEDHGEVHRLRTGVVNGEGELVDAREVEQLRAVAFDHTIGPRDAVVVRYALELPAEAEGPLRIEAKLLHRSRTAALAAETCAQANTADGRAFTRASQRLISDKLELGKALDACAAPPVTEISSHSWTLGGDPAAPAEPKPARPDHERLWELGMGLYHHVQERLPESRAALEAALVALDDAPGLDATAADAARARIYAMLGAVVARQGRVDEALDIADRIAALAPDHPYPHLLRGRALAKVWRWEQAIPHLERARAANPESPQLAGELAAALGSVGRHREALAVAANALALSPRDPTLLRAQALALRALADPRAEAALDAYFEHRIPDEQPHLAARCGERDPSCARERVPVHVHDGADPERL